MTFKIYAIVFSEFSSFIYDPIAISTTNNTKIISVLSTYT